MNNMVNNNLYRVAGLPGTGKTTYLEKQGVNAAEKYGVGNIAICSLTVAAATEIGTRIRKRMNINTKYSDISEKQVGTIHSFAYHALQHPKIAETDKDAIDSWNEKYPSLRMSCQGKKSWGDAQMYQETHGDNEYPGDEFLSRVNVYRHQMIDPCATRYALLDPVFPLFYRAWTQHKVETSTMDFTDLLECAYYNVDSIPWRPQVLFMDEAQDASKLASALIQKWASHCDVAIFAGDSNQTLYEWAGVKIEDFLDLPIATPGHRKYLLQGYRCPQKVTDIANSLIYRASRHEDRELLPRKDNDEIALGEVHKVSHTWFDAKYEKTQSEPPLIVDLLKASEHGTVGVLVSCAYMLNSIISQLRHFGIPFHNPYRMRNGAWNPMRTDAQGVSTASRLLSYFRPLSDDGQLWTVNELKNFVELLSVDGVMSRGAKAQIERLNKDDAISLDQLRSWFAPSWPDIGMCELSWLKNHIVPSKAKSIEYPMNIYEKFGAERLSATPKITVGTIHSVKGATFDTVFLFPDLSPQSVEDYHLNGRDAIIRMFYVGVTRAKHTLNLCQGVQRKQSFHIA